MALLSIFNAVKEEFEGLNNDIAKGILLRSRVIKDEDDEKKI